MNRAAEVEARSGAEAQSGNAVLARLDASRSAARARLDAARPQGRRDGRLAHVAEAGRSSRCTHTAATARSTAAATAAAGGVPAVLPAVPGAGSTSSTSSRWATSRRGPTASRRAARAAPVQAWPPQRSLRHRRAEPEQPKSPAAPRRRAHRRLLEAVTARGGRRRHERNDERESLQLKGERARGGGRGARPGPKRGGGSRVCNNDIFGARAPQRATPPAA